MAHMAQTNAGQFAKILVANRGEIACRVFRTAKRLGIKTVAVYSDADANAQHVKLADEAVHIGPSPAAESYLRQDKILAAAAQTGAQAIHPGYGFLSENAEFSEACAAAGVKFIGPPASAIKDMGSKSASKDIMIAAGVPVTPGYHGEDQSPEALAAAADEVGYPLMIKAVLGGGGKGMRICSSPDDLQASVEACQREALKSFGDERVLLERYLPRPRHVELQVFADDHDNVVHLFERDCSVQRRHQKVLEEAPAPLMTEELRAKMGASAVDAARAVGYRGAGTVEFMVDEDNETFFFMEMNTRLQVEHPVTEMITGQDLVEWQLSVAAGHPLPKTQDELSIHGHAIEARIYAENPYRDFLPGTGTLHHVARPAGWSASGAGDGAQIRVDTGVGQGDEVSIFYDPMIAKLIVWAPGRDAALAKLHMALKSYQVVGLPTNVDFVAETCMHPQFVKGGVDTSFLTVYGDDLTVMPPPPPPHAKALAAVACVLHQAQASQAGTSSGAGASLCQAKPPPSPWALDATESARLFGTAKSMVPFACSAAAVRSARNGSTRTVALEDAEDVTVEAAELDGDGTLRATIGNTRFNASVVFSQNTVSLFGLDHLYKHEFEFAAAAGGPGGGAGSASMVVTPMPGRVIKVLAAAGDEVKAGQQLLILEAMKMEHAIEAPRDGVLDSIVGDEAFVNDGDVLVSLVEE